LALVLSAAPAHGQAGPGPTVVAASDNTFLPRTITRAPNTTVYFENRGLDHNVKFEDGLFEQPADPTPTPWRVWRHFDDVGVYAYYCESHGGPGGVGMSGTVIIESAPGPVLSGLKVTPKRICDRRTRRCRRTRAKVSFQLSEAARVTGGIDPVGAPAGRPSTDIEIDGKAGANTIPVTGRGLRAGVYRVTLAAEDPDGNESDPAAVRFRVKRGRR
jgi:plastocyanin